ncbi:MAG: hypothetical protein MK291_11745 [Planctomycetes bacterium]|nr:hypothetical protein [Planctomycetota bacterium]
MPLIDLFRLTGVLGLLAAILYPTCVLLAALLAGSRHRDHQRSVAVFAAIPALIGLATRLVYVLTANLRIERDGDYLIAGELAQAYSHFDTILFAGLGTSAICYFLLAISFLRDTTRTATSFFVALIPAVLLFAGSLRTADVQSINRKIHFTDGALIEDILPYQAITYGSSEEFSKTQGPLRPEYQRAWRYTEQARNASLALLLLALMTWGWSRRKSRAAQREPA